MTSKRRRCVKTEDRKFNDLVNCEFKKTRCVIKTGKKNVSKNSGYSQETPKRISSSTLNGKRNNTVKNTNVSKKVKFIFTKSKNFTSIKNKIDLVDETSEINSKVYTRTVELNFKYNMGVEKETMYVSNLSSKKDFQNYYNVEEIGSGSYNTVFKATQTPDPKSKIFAIRIGGYSKKENDIATNDNQNIGTDVDEAKMSVRLSALNILPNIYSVFFARFKICGRKHLVYVMELGETDVEEYFKSEKFKKLSREKAIIFAKQYKDLYKRLIYNNDVFCTDIKPENAVVLKVNGEIEARIIDVDPFYCGTKEGGATAWDEIRKVLYNDKNYNMNNSEKKEVYSAIYKLTMLQLLSTFIGYFEKNNESPNFKILFEEILPEITEVDLKIMSSIIEVNVGNSKNSNFRNFILRYAPVMESQMNSYRPEKFITELHQQVKQYIDQINK
jgi:hypothetical protein